MIGNKSDDSTSIVKMSDSDWQHISTQLRQYNVEQSSGLSVDPDIRVRLTLKDKEVPIGGIAGRAFYKSFMIDHLWIDKEHRRKGYGKKLLIAAEKIAKEHGCISAQTSSYSFQAPEFYQKLGYEVFGVFDGYPNGVKKLYLGKLFSSSGDE